MGGRVDRANMLIKRLGHMVYQFNSRWIKSSTAGFTQFSFSVSDFIHRGVPMRSLADALGHDVLPWSTWDASNHLLV